MSHRILGVGVGVFIISIVWIVALGLAVIFSKTKRPLSFLGSGSIALATLITVVLLCIPRDSEVSDTEPDLLPPDYLFIWRSALLAFLSVCLILGIVLMVTEHWAVPLYAKPLRKGFSRNTNILKDLSE